MRIALAITLGLTLSACSVAPAPPDRYYRVEVPPAGSTTNFSGRILIEPFEAYGIYNERPLVFHAADASSALEQYHYQFWAEPPGMMLRDAMIAYLRTGLSGAQVEAAGGRQRGDLTVHTRLKRLEHRLGSPPQAVFAAEFRIIDASDNERATLVFDETIAAGGASVEDFVLAMDQLVGKAYGQLVERVRESAAQPSSR